jgi:DNA-binding beta-propeller fold protein YncE
MSTPSPACSLTLRSLRFAAGVGLALVVPLAAAGAAQQATNAPLVWPPPPDAPRLAYVQSIRQSADVGVKPSGLTRFARWIVGSNKGNESLEKPFGLALDERDNLCLTDTGAKSVCFFDRTAKKWLRWEKVGALVWSSPVAVAKHGGTLFVADSGLGSIVAFDLKGKLLFQITNRLERPCGLAVLGDRLLAVDSQRHSVLAFDFTGGFLSEFGRRGVEPGEFNFPTHLATGGTNLILVTDSMNHRVQVFDAGGAFLRQIGSVGDGPGCFSRPKGVAADGAGRVYVMDAMFDNLQIFDGQARFLMPLGKSGGAPGEFWMPNGIAISHSNQVFIADTYNHRIQVFQYVGQP